MGPRIVNVSKQDQQDATLHNAIYYYKFSTYFRRFFRPPSGAQKLYTEHRVFVELFLLLITIVNELELSHESGKKH